jgi:protein-disulfide isomerase
MDDYQPVKLKNAVSESDHVQGPSDAAVTLVEYGDFECIDCGRAFPAIRALRRLLDSQLRFVYRHFPIAMNHPHAFRAAEAAEAANAQGKFWEMHDQLFEHQDALEDHHLTHYAKHIGLDVAQFERDLNEHSFLKIIENDYQRSLFDEHITGTPTIYVNELRYTGPTDSESLLISIKAADVDNRIEMPETATGIRGLLHRLRHHGQ